MLVYPEMTKEELEHLNQMVQPIEKFFNEGCKYTVMERGGSNNRNKEGDPIYRLKGGCTIKKI